MLEILDLSFKLNLNISEEKLVDIGLQSYDLALEAQKRFLDYPESNIHVWVEQGSVNYKYKIWLGLSILYNVVSGMDGFIGGIEKIVDYSNRAMNYITEKTINSNVTKNANIVSHKRSAGFPDRVKYLMNEVRKGNITPNEATEKLLKLLEQEDSSQILKENFENRFKLSSSNIYRIPSTQLELYPLEDYKVPLDNQKSKSNGQKLPYSHPMKPLLQGIEIWQDLETGVRKFKIYAK